MASKLLPLTLTPQTLPPSSSSSSSYLPSFNNHTLFSNNGVATASSSAPLTRILFLLKHRRTSTIFVPFAGKEDTELRVFPQQENDDEATPEDLEYVNQIKRVLELLRKNRDMLFGEVKLTIMIEDPREIERRRLLGIEDPDAPTRDDLVAALEEVNEGKIPKNKVALQMLAEELASWPNLEAEAPKQKPGKSLYAKATDTGIDPQLAAKNLNID